MLIIYFPGKYPTVRDAIFIIFAYQSIFLWLSVMYLNLLGLEKGVDANTAFNTVNFLFQDLFPVLIKTFESKPT